MISTISTGLARVRFVNIPLNDDAREDQTSDLLIPVFLKSLNDKLVIHIKLFSLDDKIDELWDIGIDNDINSSSILELFGEMEIISTSDKEFLVRFWASKIEQFPDEVNEWLNIYILAKFETNVPSQLTKSKQFFLLHK
jgi:hypothetical protein